jgi:hypothetical protein
MPGEAMSAAVPANTAEGRFEAKAGDRLAARDPACARELNVVPHCPFIPAFIAKNVEFSDPVA